MKTTGCIRKAGGWLGVALLGLVLALTGCQNEPKKKEAAAQYPVGQLDFVAPGGVGGGWDSTIRATAKVLQETKIVTAPIAVRNAGGGGGAVHLASLQPQKNKANAGTHENTITVYSPPILFFNLNGSSPYGFRDTTPLARLIADYAVFVVKADSPYQTIGDVMEALKKDPKSVKVGGTSARGSMDHVQFLIIAQAAGVQELNKIDYRSFDVDRGNVTAEERRNTALAEGGIDLVSTSLADVMELIESGEFRAIAQTAERRIGTGKQGEIPTCVESGINATFINWRGLFGPPEMPENAVAYWRDALKKLQAAPAWKAICEKNGWDSIYLDAPEFRQFLEKTEKEYISVMQSIGMLKK